MNRSRPRRLAITALTAVMVWSLTSYAGADPVTAAATTPSSTAEDERLGDAVLRDNASGKTLAELNAEAEARLRNKVAGEDLHSMADDGAYLVVTDAGSPQPRDASTPSAAAIDEMTWAECAANFDDTVAPYWFKNKYNVCRRARVIVDSFERSPDTGALIKVGEVRFVMELIGTARNQQSVIDFRFRMLEFDLVGSPHLHTPFVVQLPCSNADPARTSTCTALTGSPSSYEMPIGDWRNRSGEEFTLTKTGATTAVPSDDKHQSELRGFFVFGLHMTTLSDWGAAHLLWPEETLRCDVATYVDGSYCVYNNVASVLQFRLSDTTLSQSAAFIGDAQTDITRTYPGVAGKKVPGAIGEQPLHRLFSTYDTNNTYKATRRKVPKTCRRYYGVNYSQNRTRDCDEYPFASTYENAASVDPSGPYDYAVRAISASHNRTAGGVYSAWLAADHILDRDPFWVKIVP